LNVHGGHRMRLDKKVIEKGLEMLEPHEQLEHLLFAVIPRGDTNALAHRLLDKFVTVAGVINADVEELMTIDGVGKRTAMFLTSLPQLLGIVERSISVEAPPKLETTEDVATFVRSYFYGKLTEEIYVMSLNSSFRLLAVSKLSEGAPNEAYIYPSLAVKQAIRDNASVVIIAHNHPCGLVNPSKDDITLSAKLHGAFKSVDIQFKDSVIIAGSEYYSIAEGYDLERLWKSMAKEEKNGV